MCDWYLIIIPKIDRSFQQASNGSLWGVFLKTFYCCCWRGQNIDRCFACYYSTLGERHLTVLQILWGVIRFYGKYNSSTWYSGLDLGPKLKLMFCDTMKKKDMAFEEAQLYSYVQTDTLLETEGRHDILTTYSNQLFQFQVLMVPTQPSTNLVSTPQGTRKIINRTRKRTKRIGI